jgi:hypothetical protein
VDQARKKRIREESVRHGWISIGGLVFWFLFYRVLGIEINYVMLIAGVLVTILFVDVVRVVLWVFKQKM